MLAKSPNRDDLNKANAPDTFTHVDQQPLHPADIYAPARLTEVTKVVPNAFRPVEEWDAMVVQAEQHAQGIDIAVKMAEFIKPWDTGAIGFITMACRMLREATVALGQFFSLLNDVYKLNGGTSEDQFQVVMPPRAPFNRSTWSD